MEVKQAVCAASSVAHAQLIAPKGAQAQIKVEYAFSSEGEVTSPSKDQRNKWKVHRVASMTAIYAAEAPQSFGTLHSKDSKQKQDIAAIAATASAAQAKMSPTMNDMMKIVQDCGGTDSPGAEDCISKKVSSYGDKMQVIPDIKSADADISKISQMGAGTRFQLWNLVSQSGTWSVGEQISHQIFELTCTESKKCIRVTTRNGGGAISAPPGGRSVAGASSFEVDGLNKDVELSLPVPLMPLEVMQTVETTIPNESGGTTETVVKSWMMTAAKPMTLSISKALGSESGTKRFAIQGEREESGTLTVSWSISRL